MNIETMSFKKGMGSKASLDVGIFREENIKYLIERGLEKHLFQFFNRKHYIMREDGSLKYVSFHPKGAYNTFLDAVTISVDKKCWNERYIKYFKLQTREWFNSMGYKIVNFYYVEKYKSYTLTLEKIIK